MNEKQRNSIREEIVMCINHGLDDYETASHLCDIYPDEMDSAHLVGVIRDLMSEDSTKEPSGESSKITIQDLKEAAHAYNKYHRAGSLSNKELTCGIKVLGMVVDLMRKINDRKLDLFTDRLYLTLNALQEYKDNRKAPKQ